MKKIIFLSIVLAMTLISCEKDNQDAVISYNSECGLIHNYFLDQFYSNYSETELQKIKSLDKVQQKKTTMKFANDYIGILKKQNTYEISETDSNNFIKFVSKNQNSLESLDYNGSKEDIIKFIDMINTNNNSDVVNLLKYAINNDFTVDQTVKYINNKSSNMTENKKNMLRTYTNILVNSNDYWSASTYSSIKKENMANKVIYKGSARGQANYTIFYDAIGSLMGLATGSAGSIIFGAFMSIQANNYYPY